MHVAGLAADVGFVHFDVAAELAAVFSLHGEPETREHEPRGFLGDAERAGQFVAADAVLAVGEQPERRQPLLKRRSAESSKMVPTLSENFGLRVLPVALPAAGVLQIGDVLGAAMRAAHHAIRPADRLDGPWQLS